MCVIMKDGTGECWGTNGNGQLGDSTTNHRRRPEDISLPSGKSLKSIDAGGESTCGIMNTGELYCWGYNGYGNLGDGTTNRQNSPKLVSLPAHLDVVSVATGYFHTCAIMSNRSMWCWGSEGSGQLSYEDSRVSSDQRFPVMSHTPTTKVRSVSAGRQFTCLISHDYNVWCAGANDAGQLGDATTSNRHSFVKTKIP